ncbi:MAG: hypothetical protein GY701_05795 [Sulfitobacter sp.]|nr:hypothetical protein [Sulfitobacter sp.]
MRQEHKDALLVLADVYLNQGKTGRTVVLLEALNEVWPRDSQIIKALSFGYLVDGRHADALKAADAYLRFGALTSQNVAILLIRSKALWALGRVTEARESIAHYMELSGQP